MHIFNPYPYGYIPCGYIPCAPWSPAITPNYYGAYFTPQYTPPSPQAYYCPPPRPTAYCPSTPPKRPSAYGGNRARQAQPTTTRTTQNVHTAAVQRLYHAKLRTLQTEETQARSDITLEETHARTTTQTARRTTQPRPVAQQPAPAIHSNPYYLSRMMRIFAEQRARKAITQFTSEKINIVTTEGMERDTLFNRHQQGLRVIEQMQREQNIIQLHRQRLIQEALGTRVTEERHTRTSLEDAEQAARTDLTRIGYTEKKQILQHTEAQTREALQQRLQSETQRAHEAALQKLCETEQENRQQIDYQEGSDTYTSRMAWHKEFSRISTHTSERGHAVHEEAQARNTLQQQEATDFTDLQQRLQSETQRAYTTALHRLYEAEGQQRTEIAGQEASEHNAQRMLGFQERARISTHAFERGDVVHEENMARGGLTTQENSERRELSEQMTRTRPQRALDRVIAHHNEKYSAERMIRLACQVVHDSLPWWIQDAAEKAAEATKAQASMWHPDGGIDKHGIQIPKAQVYKPYDCQKSVLTCITYDEFPSRDASPDDMRLDLAVLAEKMLSKHKELCAWLRNTEVVSWTEEQAAKEQWKELVGVIRTWYDYETNKKWLAYAHTLFPSRSIYDKDALSAAWKEAKYDFHTLCQMVARRAHEKMEPPHADVRDISTQSEGHKRVLQTQENQEWQALCHRQDEEQKKLAPIKIRDALKKTPVDIALIDHCAAHLSTYETYPMLAQIDMLSPYILHGGGSKKTIDTLVNIQQVSLTQEAVLYAAANLQGGFRAIREKAHVTEDKKLHAACLCIASKHNKFSVLEACNVIPCVFHAVNQPDENGMTPLHYAAQNNNHHIVTTLLTYDADPLKQNAQGRIPVDLCQDPQIRNILTQFRGANDPEKPQYPKRYYGDVHGLDHHRMLHTFSPYVLERLSADELRMRMVSHQCLEYAKQHPDELSPPLSTPASLKELPGDFIPSLAPNGSGIYLLQLTSGNEEYATWFTKSERKRRTAATYPILCDNVAASMSLAPDLPPREELKYNTTDTSQDHPRAVRLYSAPIFLCASSQGLIQAISFDKLPICCDEALRQGPLWQELLALADYYFPGGDLPRFLREQGPDTLSPDLCTHVSYEERHAKRMHTPPMLSEPRARVIKLQEDWSKLCNMIGHYHNAEKIQEEKRAQHLYEKKYPGAIQRVLDSDELQNPMYNATRQMTMNAISRGIDREAKTAQQYNII